MKRVELLAPGGSMESLYAAVLAGCNAIYMGGSKFSARAYANNFDDNQLIEAVDYCHIYGVKVYVAVNTLIKENEFEEAINYVKFLYKIGVDGLIIQDLGLFYAIKKLLPDFELHASTQMTVHNGEGAKFLKELDFKRIVLSRELSLKEIKYISKDLNIETEMFIHGALCVCYSGQCLMSSIIGGRSGNRGRCAQPCRLPYKLINKENNEIKEGYLLSPKDMCTLEDIDKIIESGTYSLKIEGRMKRPEYVAGVVSTYRNAIDNFYSKKEKLNYKKENKKLAQLFNREGFSKAYLFKNVGKDMMAYSFPKNTGIYIGKVNKDLTINLEEDVHLKDGIRVEDSGFTISSIKLGKNEVEIGKKGEKVLLKPTRYKAGDILYKTSDTQLLEDISKIYEEPYSKKMNLDLKIKFKINEPIEIVGIFNDKFYYVKGDQVQKPLKRPLEKESLLKSLNKLGDTPFRLNKVEFDYFEEGFMAVSSINNVRRTLTNAIIEDIKEKYRREDKLQLTTETLKENEEREEKLPKMMVVVSTFEQLKATLESGIKDIAIDFFLKGTDLVIDKVKNIGDFNLYIKTPNIIKEELDDIVEFIDNNIKNIKGILTSNLGIISKFKNKVSIIGDYKLNIFNSYSSMFYNKYLQGGTLSIELNHKEFVEVAKKSTLPIQPIIYGKYELMVSEYCPIGSTFGNKCGTSNCRGECTKGTFVLRDRKGEEFKVLTDKYCRSHIYNSVPVNLIPNIKEYKRNNINSFRVDFIDEDYDKVKNILDMVKNEKFQGDYKNYTRGHYKRGVE